MKLKLITGRAQVHLRFGGLQRHVGGAVDARIVAERCDLDGSIGIHVDSVGAIPLNERLEIDIGRGRRAAAQEEELQLLFCPV